MKGAASFLSAVGPMLVFYSLLNLGVVELVPAYRVGQGGALVTGRTTPFAENQIMSRRSERRLEWAGLSWLRPGFGISPWVHDFI